VVGGGENDYFDYHEMVKNSYRASQSVKTETLEAIENAILNTEFYRARSAIKKFGLKDVPALKPSDFRYTVLAGVMPKAFRQEDVNYLLKKHGKQFMTAPEWLDISTFTIGSLEARMWDFGKPVLVISPKCLRGLRSAIQASREAENAHGPSKNWLSRAKESVGNKFFSR
jgi:hypothetical protein